MGWKFSMDEQNIGFQGNHSDKLGIIYKVWEGGGGGGGVQVDSLCDGGFIYTF